MRKEQNNQVVRRTTIKNIIKKALIQTDKISINRDSYNIFQQRSQKKDNLKPKV